MNNNIHTKITPCLQHKIWHLGKRVRYNSSNMDTYIAEKEAKFGQLPDIYVIYISKNDFLGEGQTLLSIVILII